MMLDYFEVTPKDFSLKYYVPSTDSTAPMFLYFDGQQSPDNKWADLNSVSVYLCPDPTLTDRQHWVMTVRVQAPVRSIFRIIQKTPEDEMRACLFDALQQLRFNTSRTAESQFRFISGLLERAVYDSTESING